MLRAKSSSCSKQRREILLKYKRTHLEQQKQEREVLEEHKLEAHRDFLIGTQQPTTVCFLTDAMSNSRCNMPIVNGGNMRKSKADETATMSDRVMAVEVHCGHITTMFLYHSHDFISHGANYMIEVMR